MVESSGNRRPEKKKKEKKKEKSLAENKIWRDWKKQVPYTISYMTPGHTTPSGGGSHLESQSDGSGYQDLGPKSKRVMTETYIGIVIGWELRVWKITGRIELFLSNT